VITFDHHGRSCLVSDLGKEGVDEGDTATVTVTVGKSLMVMA
jgi:hypothetical protein